MTAPAGPKTRLRHGNSKLARLFYGDPSTHPVVALFTSPASRYSMVFAAGIIAANGSHSQPQDAVVRQQGSPAGGRIVDGVTTNGPDFSITVKKLFDACSPDVRDKAGTLACLEAATGANSTLPEVRAHYAYAGNDASKLDFTPLAQTPTTQTCNTPRYRSTEAFKLCIAENVNKAGIGF